MRRGRGGRSSGEPRPEKRVDPERLDSLPAGSDPASPFLLSELQLRYVTQFINVLKSPATREAPFLFIFQRGVTELPPSLLIDGLWDASDENLLIDHLGDLARALLPADQAARLVVTLQSLAVEFAAAPAANEPRYFFPLNPTNVLLGANVPAANGAPPTHVVWLTGNEDAALAAVQPRRTMRVALPPNCSMRDRVTMSLFLLVRVSRGDGAQALLDAMPDWPGAEHARRFLVWQVLWNMFNDMQSGFGMLPPAESIKMLPMTGSIIDAFRSIDLLPKWSSRLAADDDASVKEILADVNRAQMSVVDMAARGAIHRFSWTRSVAHERAVVLAMRDGKYASLLHLFADLRGTLWMATTPHARSAIGHLLVDSRPAQFDEHNRLRVSSALPEAHAIEFTVEERRVKIMIVHGGTVPLPLEQIAFPDDAMTDATQMEIPAAAPPPAAAPSAHVHSPVQAHALAPHAVAPPPLPLPISPQHAAVAPFSPPPPPPPSVAPTPLPLNGHSHAPDAPSPPTPRGRKRTEQKEWEQELRNAMEGVPLAVMPGDGGWWRSMRSLLLRFASEHGKLIWFHRDNAASQTWRQEDPASNKPAGAPDATLRSWWEWHQTTSKKGNLRELRDVYYLVDIEVRADDLDKLHRTLPLMQCLDDDTCLYSLNHYIVKVLGNTISTHFDLRPRLSFAPGFLPGVVSTPLHIEGLGHLTSYQWLLGFNTGGVTLLDIYSPDDRAKLQEVCGPGACAAGEWWSAPYSLAHQSQASVRSGCDLNAKLTASGIRPWRQVELKAQQFVMIPAGHPCAAKKWPSSADPTQPIVTLEGHLTWLGFNTISASSNLERMRSVEKTYQRQFLYPELGMLCALMLQPETAEEAQLQHEHMLAAAPLLRDILDKEQRCLQAVGMPTAVAMDDEARLQAWSCSSCNVVLINGHMFCTVNATGLKRAFCLDCWAEAHQKGYGLLDAKKNQLPLEQHSAQVIHMKGSKRLRDDASIGDDGFYANDDDGANDGEPDFGLYDDDDDDDGPVNDAAAHTAGWDERHTHRLMFRFGPPRDVLIALEEACSAVRAVGSRALRPAKATQSAAAPPTPRGRKAAQAAAQAVAVAVAVPPSPVPAPHSPASASVLAFAQAAGGEEGALLPQLELMVAQRRADFDHGLCRQLRDYEQDLLTQLQAADADAGAERPKRKRGALLDLGDALEHALRLENDLSRYCHESLGPVDCILCEKDLDAYLQGVWGKMPKACTQAHSCQPCGHKASWQKPLYRCPRDHSKVRSDTAYRFHLECNKAYQGVPVPFQTPMLCADCLADMAKERGAQPLVLVRQHIWEQTKAAEELFKAGFEIIDIDADGLCLFTVLLHLVRGEEAKQASADEVLKWVMGKPYELLVAHTAAQDSPTGEHAAMRAELALWPHRSREQWRKEWYSPAFDSICGLLPALLERAGLFKQTYLRYAYDSITGRGRWYISEIGAYPAEMALPQNLKFAAIRYGTPVEHYALLEKRPGF